MIANSGIERIREDGMADAEGKFNSEVASLPEPGSRRETYRSRADNAAVSLMNPAVRIRLIALLVNRSEHCKSSASIYRALPDGNNEAIFVIMLYSYGKLNTLA